MKIYLVERTDSIGYDEYDSFVVYADSENEAILETFLGSQYGWDVSMDKLKVTYIGENKDISEQSTILGSFNAG